jgi:[acyl-carrier-protein] S-malonyltransferase
MNELALVFPGQGSQSKGMLDSYITENSALAREISAEASDILGYDIAKLIAEDEQKLNQTEFTQPALLTAGVIAWKIWQAEGHAVPKLLAGHSLGEYTALVCAKALSFAEGLKLVAKRGALMQQAVAPGAGAMAAILGLELAQVTAICAAVTEGTVQAANINAPGQIVIAGTTQGVELAITRAKDLGAKRAIMLPVSVPSHCVLMQPAAQELMQDLAAVKWQKPLIPVIHNFDVASHDDADSIMQALAKQLYSPVRWVETIEYFVQHGITEVVECGPGKVLTGLNKRIAPQLFAGAGVC